MISSPLVYVLCFPTEVFGWLFLGDVYDSGTNGKESIANHGLKDQQMAFKWTKENVALLGGDPNKVSHSNGHSHCNRPVDNRYKLKTNTILYVTGRKVEEQNPSEM